MRIRIRQSRAGSLVTRLSYGNRRCGDGFQLRQYSFGNDSALPFVSAFGVDNGLTSLQPAVDDIRAKLRDGDSAFHFGGLLGPIAQFIISRHVPRAERTSVLLSG